MAKISEYGKKINDIHNPVQYKIDNYLSVVEKIKKIDIKTKSESELKTMSLALKKRAQDGEDLDSILVEAFAVGREASKRTLGMMHFDVQLAAGIALHNGKIIEMQTGEGKTLAAVLPAYLNAMTNNGVHILTFNDYLVKRDAEWMRPIYEFLGVSVSYIVEGMSVKERQKAYEADITYITAKEAGFDYLRDFLCEDKELLLHKQFSFAIIDEADSILIDEARIPLVIAGNHPHKGNKKVTMTELVKGFGNSDYEIDEYGSNVYLTDKGLVKVEEIMECGNLYDEKNMELLSSINCALYAEVLLKKDKDYIVRNGKIELIDEFTGRVADKRHWPDNLHAAVEAKEEISTDSKGIIMGNITLQHFINLYPKVAGMSGTAHTSAKEFVEFYGVDVVVIPTNKPCVRKDHSDKIYATKNAKTKALIQEIKNVHAKGQPVLIGTGSVEESEQLSELLEKEKINYQVLNAKNDEMEAGIIANAGRLGAVTVSTNMAGRGVDIKLGGETGDKREQIINAGGLYVIGTNRNESRRIDNQLKGRAGRQGDPGESRLFISLEDDLMVKYDITKLVPKHAYKDCKDDPISNQIALKEIDRGQRIVEGHNSDIRRQLLKYAFIIEEQRKIVYDKRQKILLDEAELKILKNKATERYAELCKEFGEEVLYNVEKKITLYYINKNWADHLDYISYIRESIHLVVIGRKNPIDEFHKSAIESFDEMLKNIENDIVEKFNNIEINKNGIVSEDDGLKGPATTWTYLINDSAEQFSNLPHIMKTFSTFASAPLFTIKSLFNKITKKK